MTLTVEKLMATMREVQAKSLPPQPHIIFTTSALKETTDRIFPASKHRSKRVRKKLIKRHGGEYRKTPAVWRVGDKVYAHPALMAQFENAFPLRPYA